MNIQITIEDVDITQWGSDNPDSLSFAIALCKEWIHGTADWPDAEKIRIDVCNGETDNCMVAYPAPELEQGD